MKKGSLLLLSSFAVAIALVLVLLPTVTAQDNPRDRFQYAAKFLCTANIPMTSQTTPSVLPGSYRTVVNIHNPQGQSVQFRKKLAVSVPPARQTPGEVSRFIEDRLAADEALSVDCDRIGRDFGLSFIHGAEGFLVLESPESLDVTAVYTAGHYDGQVESIAVEQINERKLSKPMPTPRPPATPTPIPTVPKKP
jgi:hypothetical protein